MKNKIVIFSLILILFGLYSCEEEEIDDTLYYEPELYQPRIVFWSNFEGPPINVYLNDSYVGKITKVVSSAPDCGDEGHVTTNIANSTYELYAEEEGSGRVWRETVTVPDVLCYVYLLSE